MKPIIKTIGSFGIGIAVIFMALLLFSCRTVKNIETLKVEVDSTAIRERDSLIEVNKLTTSAYENLVRSMSESDIVFECPPCDSFQTEGLHPNEEGKKRIAGTINNKLEFYPDGTLKSAEGRIKSARSLAERNEQTAHYWQQQYDSLFQVKQRDTTTVKTNIQYVDREVKRTFIPWWIWVIAGLGYVAWAYKLIPKPKKSII